MQQESAIEPINYTKVPPTILEFHQSDATYRCIVGPVGSGKTTGATWDVCMYLPIHIAKNYGVKRTRWAVMRNCYDDKTEILTESRGFQLFVDLNPKDKVATLQNGEIVYELPDGISVHPYAGDMIGFESEGIDFLVTPDHEMWVSKQRARKKVKTWEDYETKIASDIYGSCSYRIRRDAIWLGTPHALSEPMFEWLGFWFAEGSYGIYKNRSRYTITSVTDICYTRNLFKDAGIEYSEWRRKDGGINFVVKPTKAFNQVRKYITNVGGAGEKAVPVKIKCASKEQLLRFIKGFHVGDGSTRKEGTKVLYTSSETLASDLQEMALKAGLVANIHSRDRRGATVNINGANGKVNHIEYSVTLLSNKKYRPRLHVNKKQTNHLKGWYKKPYNGLVYCAEMAIPTVFVRRNGLAMWCNRTYPELETSTMRTVFEWFPPEIFGHFKVQKRILDIWVNHPELGVLHSEINFLACDRPDDIKKLKGGEFTGYWLDESIEIVDQVKLMLANRIGRFPKAQEWPILLNSKGQPVLDADKNPVHNVKKYGIETTNPPDVEHSTYRQFAWNVPPPGPIPEGKPLKDHVGFWQPPRENEPNLRFGYYDELRDRYRDNSDWIDIYIDGKPGIIIKGKLVYNNFKRAHHVAEKPLVWAKGPLFRGWDDSGNCPACVVVQIPRPRHIQVLKEFTTDRMNITDFAGWVVSECNQRYPGAEWTDWDDPAGHNEYSTKEGTFTSNAQLIREATGINMQASEQNLEARINSVDSALGRIDGLLVSPDCTRLINGFLGGYSYKPRPGLPGEYSDVISKNKFSHISDGLQYVLVKLEKHRTDSGKGFHPKRRRRAAGGQRR